MSKDVPIQQDPLNVPALLDMKHLIPPIAEVSAQIIFNEI